MKVELQSSGMKPAIFNAPLTDTEIDELDHLLLYEADAEDSMTLDMLDGYLHALAVGPTTIHPKRWMPRIWGEDYTDMMPPVKDIDELNRILGLITRLSNSIIANLEDPDGSMIVPLWPTFKDDDKERDDAEVWAYGFITGMNLCKADWAPLLESEQGQAWLRPIQLLGEDDFGPEQDALTRTPADREKLSLEIPDAVLAIHQYLLPHRQAVYERKVADTMSTKVGRNEPCPCGSGKKFKKCCGAAADLH